MGLFSNRVDRKSLKPGDHIYTWRTAYIYAHHGIYVEEDRVIHFTRHGQEVGTGTLVDTLLVSSAPARYQELCLNCSPVDEEDHGVVSSCLDCFLAGDVLYRYEYAVTPAFFLAKARGGTCTLAVADPDDMVVHRARYLLTHGFGDYNILKNNCEHFATYCKTGLFVLVQGGTCGRSGQAESMIRGPLAAVTSIPLRFVSNVPGIFPTAAVVTYCAGRYAADIGVRKDAVKISVEELTTILAVLKKR